MSRAVKPWKGKTDDTPVPQRVRMRVLEAKGRRCHMCGRVIDPARERWTCEHLVALVNGGENAEVNLGVTCSICLPGKNAADLAAKSYTYKLKTKHLDKHKAKSRPFPCGRDSRWKRTMDGRTVLR